MRGIVVKRDENLGANSSRKLKGLTVGAVPPPDTLAIFLFRILGIVDQEIGIGRQVIA
jgi:hypothetical protein